jgi:hypothetical protein
MFIITPALASVIKLGGQSVLIANPKMGDAGGVIINPASFRDQGLQTSESLWVSLIGLASTTSVNNTVELAPGQTFITPSNVNVWVNAVTSGHKFTAFFVTNYAVPSPPDIVPGIPGSGVGASGTGGKPFPPTGVTGLTKEIPSYLYQEYSDDDDLQGFVAAQNAAQQDYVDTFNALNLPIYTGPIVAKKLLDWVGTGLYGMNRPALESGLPNQIGPLNTWGPNWLLPLNEIEQLNPGDIVITNDDLYRRILTWHLYKSDGNYFNIRWYKRRVWRFIMGTDGTSPERMDDWFIADTEQISVSIGVERNITTRFVLGERIVTGGAMLNRWGPNGFGIPYGLGAPATQVDIQLNDVESLYYSYPPLPYMSIFKEALHSGVLEVPYQFRFTCTIG